MLTLHIANKNYSSWSLRPWVLLKQLEIPFVEALHTFAPGDNRDAFRAFSPSGLVPCLHDGDIRVNDSLAIAEYLYEQYPQVWPAEIGARAWARCASAEMHSGFSSLRSICGMNCGLRVKLHHKPDALLADLFRIDELWKEGLQAFGGPFLAGPHFTAVDAFFAPVTLRLQTYNVSVGHTATAYAERIRSLPAMQEWVKAALAETARDPEHEESVLKHGEVIADLRVRA